MRSHRLYAALLTLALAACSSSTPPAETPDAAGDATNDAPPTDVASDTPKPLDVAPDTSLDVQPPTDVTPDSAPDVTPDAASDVAPDVATDATTDVASDVTTDVASDVASDVAGDVGIDASTDASTDVAPDVSIDVAPDLACASGETRCESACVSTQTDSNNCGGCGVRCCAGSVCSAGMCALGCGVGRTACGPFVGADGCRGGTCVDLSSDSRHCGMCEQACATGDVCVSGRCITPCATGETRCGGLCVNTARDDANCGACGTVCATGQRCDASSCRYPRSCDDLHALAPSAPSGAYTIDADGAGSLAPFSVYCDMVTDGGGWTLIAASSGATNMPRFDTATFAACESASPSTPCFVGAARLAALGLVEYRWSTAAAAVDTRAPLENFRGGAPDVSALCANANEYFRTNQDSAAQGMAWSGCYVSEVYSSTSACQSMYRPVWNLQRCEGVPIAPGARSSPDFNCSPFGSVLQNASANCNEFFNVRHWRRGRACPAGQTYCDGACVDTQRDAQNCGACGTACTNQVCVAGACASVRSCAELLRLAPGTPSGAYPIDTDGSGANAPVRAFCDMSTRGGGWTLVAAAVQGTNMPRFSTDAPSACAWPTPNAPCVLGRANIDAMPFTEYAWSTSPTADDTRAPLEGFTFGAADVNATCANATEYFRCNQDIASQGMGWTGCVPTEAYMGESVCNSMFRPVWNQLTCAGLPTSPGPRTSPDYNCSPFGAVLPFGGTCDAFANMRHWRR